MSSEQSKLFTWLLENLRPANNQEFVDLIEIKSKCNLSVTSSAVGNLIVRLFKDVKIKPGRCKANWSKYTQRYYGISWCDSSSENIQFNNLISVVPPDFFTISNTAQFLKLGHFTGTIINGNKVMAEVILHCEGKWALMFMGKVIALDKVGVHDNFQFNRKSLHVLFETIRHLRYCTGVEQVNSDEENLPPFLRSMCLR